MGYSYNYDQLNRIKNFWQHDIVGTTWNNGNRIEAYTETFSYDGNGNLLTLDRNKQGGAAMDNLSYAYTRVNGRLVDNKLVAVTDATNSLETGELVGTSSYGYDQIGNLITDNSAGITNIDWNVYGKIKQINKNAGNINYTYDPSGNRVSKTANGLTTYYLRDAQGNSLAVYDNANSTNNWREQQLYGSSRLGMWKPDINLAVANGSSEWTNTGKKFFELSNHLGNVNAVINDHRELNGGIYVPTLINAQDYYAFGGMMPERNTSGVYRYGFNGKENDNEVKGEGNQQDYGMRIYDPRIGRFLSVDPITADYPYLTPYQFASNTPISAIDVDGLEAGLIQNGAVSIAGTPMANHYTTAEARKTSAKAMGIGIGAGAVVLTDIFFTKGKLSQFVLYSTMASSLNDNRAKTPEGRNQQDKDSWNYIGQAGLMWGGSKILDKAFSLLSNIPVVKNIQAKLVSSNEVNASFNQKGWESPYKSDVTLAELNLTDDVSGLVRLSGADNVKGHWFTTMDEIKGLSPVQLKDKFALKEIPTSMTPVTIKGNVRVGEAAKVKGFGDGGGFQIETLSGSQVKYGKTVDIK